MDTLVIQVGRHRGRRSAGCIDYVRPSSVLVFFRAALVRSGIGLVTAALTARSRFSLSDAGRLWRFSSGHEAAPRT